MSIGGVLNNGIVVGSQMMQKLLVRVLIEDYNESFLLLFLSQTSVSSTLQLNAIVLEGVHSTVELGWDSSSYLKVPERDDL